MAVNDIRIGDILTFSAQKQSFRVIYIDQTLIVACLLNVSFLDIRNYSIKVILDELSRGNITQERERRAVFDINELSDTERNEFLRRREICYKVKDLYGPTFTLLTTKAQKPELRLIERQYKISTSKLRRMYIRYIQSGLDDVALIDQRSKLVNDTTKNAYRYTKKRPGKTGDDVFSSKVIVTDAVRKQFDEAIQERMSGRCKTYESAYTWLINKYYSQTYIKDGVLTIEQKQESEIPTKRQFTYYARKHTSKRELDLIKTSRQEVRNDQRLLLSDTYHDVLGPGDLVEIDAVEVDVAIVSSNDRKQAIGRPIMYLMLDVYTRMILAMNVSLHNNAMLALTNLFLNLSDDKYEFCAKYNHLINDHAWLSGIIPRRIRVDRGADFNSNQFGRVCEELGIDRQTVTGATGSLKGNIEQEFRTLHAAQKPHLDNKGVISKRYDSNHHEQAVMTIEEYTKMAVDFVLHHNSAACENYPLTADMIRNNVHATPYELWQYGTKKYGAPRPIVNLDMYRYTLMTPVRASLDRTGITSNELSYINTQDQALLDHMYELHNKKEKFEARIDPRDITNLYYLRNGKLMIAPLNPMKTQNEGFSGMTLFEYNVYLKEKRRLRKEDKARTQRAKNSMHAAQEAIVQESLSQKEPSPVNTTNMRDARNKEKQRIANENSIASRIEKEKALPENQTQPVSEKDKSAVKKVTTKPVVTDYDGLSGFEAAMSMFENEEDET